MKKNKVLDNILEAYDQRKNILKLIEFTSQLSKYPIELIIARDLLDFGIETEEDLVLILKTAGIYQPIQIDIQNYFRDITRNTKNLMDENKIPSLPNY